MSQPDYDDDKKDVLVFQKDVETGTHKGFQWVRNKTVEEVQALIENQHKKENNTVEYTICTDEHLERAYKNIERQRCLQDIVDSFDYIEENINNLTYKVDDLFREIKAYAEQEKLEEIVKGEK